MRAALISDIHGNRWALEAVLEHIAGQRVSAIWNLGDILSGPLLPAETAELLLPLALPTLSGNCERGLLDCAERPGSASDRFAFEHTEAHHRRWLGGLPATLTPCPGVLLCHGTPQRDDRPLLETLEPQGQRPATQAEVEQRTAGNAARLIACGHTHIPRVVQNARGCVIVNAGSVGLPAFDEPHPGESRLYYIDNGSPHASYAIIEETERGWEASLFRVAYDWESAAATAARNRRPEWAHALRTGYALRS